MVRDKEKYKPINISYNLYEKLRLRATQNRRSAPGELHIILEKLFDDEPPGDNKSKSGLVDSRIVRLNPAVKLADGDLTAVPAKSDKLWGILESDGDWHVIGTYKEASELARGMKGCRVGYKDVNGGLPVLVDIGGLGMKE